MDYALQRQTVPDTMAKAIAKHLKSIIYLSLWRCVYVH